MNKRNKISLFFILSTFFIMLFSFAVSAKDTSSTIDLSSGTSSTQKLTLSAGEEWRISIKNSTSKDFDLDFMVTKVQNGSASSGPSLSIDGISKPDYGKHYSVFLPAQTKDKTNFIVVSSPYWIGSGTYTISLSFTATEVKNTEGILHGDPRCTHNWRDGKCYNCGGVCQHIKSKKNYHSTGDYHLMSGYGKHDIYEYCTLCDSLLSKTTEKCVLDHYEKATANTHYRYCKYCKETLDYKDVACITTKKTFVSCKKITAFDKKGTYHESTYKCPCGNVIKKLVKHTFKSNTCTECKFKRVNPGKITKLTLKQSGKPKKFSYTVPGHVSVTGVWIPTETHYAYSNSKFKVSYKLGKNISKVLVRIQGYDPRFGSNESTKHAGSKYDVFTAKKSFTCDFTSASATNRYTVYLTPYSKTGTPGKTVKKSITVKK